MIPTAVGQRFPSPPSAVCIGEGFAGPTGESYETNRDRDAFFSTKFVRELAGIFLGEDGNPRAGRAPEADEAIRRMAEWVRPELGL